MTKFGQKRRASSQRGKERRRPARLKFQLYTVFFPFLLPLLTLELFIETNTISKERVFARDSRQKNGNRDEELCDRDEMRGKFSFRVGPR